MVFINVSAADLCAHLKDTKGNGGKDLAALLDHVSHDKLVLWGWDPGVGRAQVSIPHDEFVAAFKTWTDAGAPCPPADGKTQTSPQKKGGSPERPLRRALPSLLAPPKGLSLGSKKRLADHSVLNEALLLKDRLVDVFQVGFDLRDGIQDVLEIDGLIMLHTRPVDPGACVREGRGSAPLP
jgi:hypothetical protein